MTCAHRLDGDGLRCDRADHHDEDATGGHTYTSSVGSYLDDRHEDGGHG